MADLPRRLVAVNEDLEAIGHLTRLDAREGAIGKRRLMESDYDGLVVRNAEVVAEALREAELIDQDSELLSLGNLFNIDVLFAEVDPSKIFRRFIIVEDKLARNRQAHRDVIGQILDYARSLEATTISEFKDALPANLENWVDANADLIHRGVEQGEFLLIICGDHIRTRLIDYIRYLADKLDPLNRVELALLAMAIYSDGDNHLLVPHIVGGMTTSAQQLNVNVVVTDENDNELNGDVTVDFQSKRSQEKPTSGAESWWEALLPPIHEAFQRIEPVNSDLIFSKRTLRPENWPNSLHYELVFDGEERVLSTIELHIADECFVNVHDELMKLDGLDLEVGELYLEWREHVPYSKDGGVVVEIPKEASASAVAQALVTLVDRTRDIVENEIDPEGA